ncbi:transposase [Streptomyces sp. NPDC006307]|uniref:transposase n=1 Tax=Streptomyces sp. NPDC006307 TaxID=3156748 RepID=UPI00339EE64F
MRVGRNADLPSLRLCGTSRSSLLVPVHASWWSPQARTWRGRAQPQVSVRSRHRWTMERTMSWLGGCRRLHRRYERKAEHFLVFAGIAAALICYRRLAA